MPIFYAMAGFFAALLLARYGLRRAAWNRPLVMLLIGTGLYNFDIALGAFASGRVWRYAHPMHLWFLEYLIVLYLLAVVVMALVQRLLQPAVRQWLLQAFRWIVGSPWAPLMFAVPSFAAQPSAPC